MTSPFQPIHLYKGYNNHVLIQSVQFILVPSSPLTPFSDWAYFDLRNLLSKTTRTSSSDVDNANVSDPYVRIGLINALYNIILLLHESACEFNWFFNQ
jgi:hypothetical protein